MLTPPFLPCLFSSVLGKQILQRCIVVGVALRIDPPELKVQLCLCLRWGDFSPLNKCNYLSLVKEGSEEQQKLFFHMPVTRYIT
jgi:hypothetical protein